MHICLQQDAVLSEIERYGAPNSECDRMTLRYLTALNSLFERGILCREHITVSEQSVLDRIKEGFDFFSNWRNDVIKKGDLYIYMYEFIYYICLHVYFEFTLF